MKMRAWDVAEKCWIPPVDCAINFNGNLLTYDTNTDRWALETIEYELSRGTGLTDKNGKEIFEGDITKYSFGKHFWINEIKEVGGQFGNELFAVEIRNNLCRDMGTGMYNYEISTENAGRRNSMQSGKDVEIIGNIYENSELLTQ